jgi:CubicO group peptidase (beta-lactamase class C family)
VQVTLENWQVGPANRWAYHHVDEIVPTVTVSRGDGAAGELPRAEVDLGDVFAEHLAGAYVDGVVVLHAGRLVAERYEGGMTAEDRHLSQSVGKSVLGLLVGVLVDRGELRVEDEVAAHVPEVAASGYAGATVGHLLDMTAAIDFVEDYENFWRYDLACGWFPARPGEPGTILEFLPTIGRASWEHGERFLYATPNTDLLGLVAERAGGAPLAELFSRHLWRVLGAERDALLTVDPAGTGAIGGGFCATVRDYARLGQLVLEDGGDVVSAEWTHALGHGDPDAWARGVWAIEEADGTTAYGRQWRIRDGRVVASGIHGQTIIVDRPSSTVLAIFSSWPEASDLGLGRAQRRFADAVVSAL